MLFRSVSAGQAALADLERFFPDTLHWSQNDAWYLELRDRLAQAIVDLQHRSRENTDRAKAHGF